MKVYSISFNKGDYAYSIAYHERNDDMQLDTNEAALDSMKVAKGALKEALREYASINELFEIEINKVVFGKENKDNSIKFCAINKLVFPPKLITMSTNIPPVGKREKEVESSRAKVLINIESLYDEVERYLNGERSQGAFEFDDEIDIMQEALEETKEELDLPEQIEDMTAEYGDIDIFN